MSQPGSRQGDQKNLFLKYIYLEIWSRHHSLLRKNMEKPKLKKSANQSKGSRIGYV